MDIETTGLRPWEDKITLIAIRTDKQTYILDAAKYAREFLTDLTHQLGRCQVLIAHNAKFECGFFFANYGVLLSNWWCTMLGSQILTNGKDGIDDHSLPAVVQRYLGIRSEFAEDKKLLQKSFTSGYALDRFTERQLRYSADDVQHLADLYQKERELINEDGLHQIINLENTLIPILSKMEIEGCLIDQVRGRS